jgi:hypothetical protein
MVVDFKKMLFLSITLRFLLVEIQNIRQRMVGVGEALCGHTKKTPN